MKRLLVICISILIIFNACEQGKNKPIVADTSFKIPTANGPINDYEKVFSAEENYWLLHLVGDFKSETGIEIAIATFDTTMVTKEKFNDFTLVAANKWGIGEKHKNNGVLIGFSKGYRMIRINNGYGIEKLITDAETKNIMDSFFITNFKKDKYYEGTFKGTQELIKLLKSKIQKKTNR